jgi:hypothetical protein
MEYVLSPDAIYNRAKACKSTVFCKEHTQPGVNNNFDPFLPKLWKTRNSWQCLHAMMIRVKKRVCVCAYNA